MTTHSANRLDRSGITFYRRSVTTLPTINSRAITECLARAGWFKRRRRLVLILLAGAAAICPGSAPFTGFAAQPNPTAVESAQSAQEEAAALKNTAVTVARQVAEAYPKDPLSYALLGSACYNTGRAEEAARQLRKCLELNPDQADAFEILARVAYEKGELDETVRLCQESLKRNPKSPDVLNRLGRAFMDQGRTQEAIQTLQQATRLPEPVSESYYLLGQAHLQSNDYALAKADFQRAIALVPDHTQAFFGLFTACLRLGQVEEATRHREEFQKLESIDRRSLRDRSAQEDSLTGLPQVRQTVARTFFGAGQLYAVHGETGKAGELLLKAAQLDAETPLYRAALERFYGKSLAEGVSTFQQLAAEQPNSHWNYYFLGRLQARLERNGDAEQAYRKVQSLAPSWAEGYRALAELYLRTNRQISEARVLARRAVELEPTGPHNYLLAIACAKNGDRAGALEALKQAVALSPDEKRFREALEQLSGPPAR